MPNGHLMTWFDRLFLRFIPSPEEIIKAELKQAEISHLEAITKLEYTEHCSKVYALEVEYQSNRIKRMNEFQFIINNVV